MVAAFSLVALLFALVISAKPAVEQNRLVSLSLTRHHNRARALKAHAGKIDSPVENFKNAVYLGSIGVGNPPTTHIVLVDTGSSNTWIGNNISYVVTNTSQQTSNDVSVVYESGNFSGREFIDQVTIAPGLVIHNQSIGVAATSNLIGFQNIDGILGLGPVDLTIKTLSPAVNSTIPTVTDNLFSANVIQNHSVGVFLTPFTNTSGEQVNGELTWGGVNTSNIVGSITYTPVVNTSRFWGIESSVYYGKTSLLNSSGIVDTGTTLIMLENDAYNTYQNATGASFDNNTNLLTISSTRFNQLQELCFVVSDVPLVLSANAQIWPRSINAVIGGVSGKIYLVVGKLASVNGPGDFNVGDFIVGIVFLERFYSVFDTGNRRVGFANTAFTNATSN